MKINLNNKEIEINDHEKINVKDLLKHMKFTFPMIVVKINGKLIKKDTYENTFVTNNDKVDAIHLIGGG